MKIGQPVTATCALPRARSSRELDVLVANDLVTCILFLLARERCFFWNARPRIIAVHKILGARSSHEVGFVKVLVESVCVCVCVCGTSRFCLVGNPLIRVEESRNKSGCWFVNCERDGRNAEQIFGHAKVGTWRENKNAEKHSDCVSRARKLPTYYRCIVCFYTIMYIHVPTLTTVLIDANQWKVSTRECAKVVE